MPPAWRCAGRLSALGYGLGRSNALRNGFGAGPAACGSSRPFGAFRHATGMTNSPSANRLLTAPHYTQRSPPC